MQQAQTYNGEAAPQPRTAGRAAHLSVAGVALAADPAGALWHEAARALIVADLHFEKGSAFAMRRQFLPPYDTAATLARLSALIMHYRPAVIVALGDSFHDARAGERMARDDYEALCSLMRGREWIWIAGNHDPAIPAGLGDMQDEWQVGPLTFRHEPRTGAAYGEIAGHLHPAARVVSPSGSLRRRCFVSNGERCILPAFGAYAGGLNIRDRAFTPLFAARAMTAHVLGRERVFAVPERHCAPD